MKAAYEMTVDEATQELEQLLDTKPEPEQVRDYTRWHKANQGRVLELETWIMMHQKKGEEAPAEAPAEPDAAPEIALMESLALEPASEPIPAAPESVAAAPSISPMEQIQKHIDRAVKATEDAAKATNKAQFKRAQNQIHQARFQVRALAKKHNIQLTDLPALPDLPHNPWTKTVEPAKKPVPPSKPAPVKKVQPSPEVEPPAPIEEAPITDFRDVTEEDNRIAERLLELEMGPLIPGESTARPRPSIDPETVRSLIHQLRTTGRAVQGLAVLLAPWGNPAVAEQLQPQGLAAVAELMAIVGLHVEAAADEAGRVA